MKKWRENRTDWLSSTEGLGKVEFQRHPLRRENANKPRSAGRYREETMIRITRTSLVVALLLLTTACGTTIRPGQRGLFWHPLSQGLSQEPLKDGFYWRAPWNDVFVYDVRWQSHTEDIDALSADDLQVLIKAAIILRPIAEELYFLNQEVGSDYYARVVKPQFMAAVRSVGSG
jgi:hypothetical protein